MEFISEDVDAFSVKLVPHPRWRFFDKLENGTLKPNKKYYRGPRELDQYLIMNMSLQSEHIQEDDIDETVVYVEITFGRDLWSIIMNIYFITFLLNVVGHSSVFYEDQYFGDQVAMNVTIMLVQVTIFQAVS